MSVSLPARKAIHKHGAQLRFSKPPHQDSGALLDMRAGQLRGLPKGAEEEAASLSQKRERLMQRPVLYLLESGPQYRPGFHRTPVVLIYTQRRGVRCVPIERNAPQPRPCGRKLWLGLD
jgi:hypothetical protein